MSRRDVYCEGRAADRVHEACLAAGEYVEVAGEEENATGLPNRPGRLVEPEEDAGLLEGSVLGRREVGLRPPGTHGTARETQHTAVIAAEGNGDAVLEPVRDGAVALGEKAGEYQAAAAGRRLR